MSQSTDPPDEQRIAQLLPFLREFEAFTGIIQDEINSSLLERPGVKEDLKIQACKPGAQVMERLNTAILGFIGAMPLAHVNDINLVMNMLKMHGNLTGDPIIEQLLIRLKEEREGPQPELE